MTRAKYKDLGKRTVEFYGQGIKNLQDIEIKGRLIVIEGPIGLLERPSGRSGVALLPVVAGERRFLESRLSGPEA